jgi:hypothetical protein
MVGQSQLSAAPWVGTEIILFTLRQEKNYVSLGIRKWSKSLERSVPARIHISHWKGGDGKIIPGFIHLVFSTSILELFPPEGLRLSHYVLGLITYCLTKLGSSITIHIGLGINHL